VECMWGFGATENCVETEVNNVSSVVGVGNEVSVTLLNDQKKPKPGSKKVLDYKTVPDYKTVSWEGLYTLIRV
jgi:hypothetical protein